MASDAHALRITEAALEAWKQRALDAERELATLRAKLPRTADQCYSTKAAALAAKEQQ